MTRQAELRGFQRVLLWASAGLFVVVLVGVLADLIYPERTLWFQFWKEPSRPGSRDTSQAPSEQAAETMEEEGITDTCWPWEWCFWAGPPTNPTGR